MLLKGSCGARRQPGSTPQTAKDALNLLPASVLVHQGEGRGTAGHVCHWEQWVRACAEQTGSRGMAGGCRPALQKAWVRERGGDARGASPSMGASSGEGQHRLHLGHHPASFTARDSNPSPLCLASPFTGGTGVQRRGCFVWDHGTELSRNPILGLPEGSLQLRPLPWHLNPFFFPSSHFILQFWKYDNTFTGDLKNTEQGYT